MSYIGSVSRDYLIANDEARYEAMERGSMTLRHAIEDYYVAKAQRRPMRPTSPDLIWRHPFTPGTKSYPVAPVRQLQPARAEPCPMCAVRADVGCRHRRTA